MISSSKKHGHNCEYCYAKLMNEKARWTEKWDQSKKREINLEALSQELDKLSFNPDALSPPEQH